MYLKELITSPSVTAAPLQKVARNGEESDLLSFFYDLFMSFKVFNRGELGVKVSVRGRTWSGTTWRPLCLRYRAPKNS